jgi:hypothetical protein
MMKTVYVLVTWLGMTVVLHTACVVFGIYDAQIAAGFVWVDNILHMMVGAGVGHAAWVYKRNAVYALCAAFVLALVWECIEFMCYIITPEFALAFKVYSPTVYEAGEDVASNMLGAVVCMWGFTRLP